jgi:hypothetical protein
MNLKLNVKNSVKVQIYFGIIFFIIMDGYGFLNHYISLSDPASMLLFFITFLPIIICLKHYLRTYEITLSGIHFINVLGQNKLIPYHDLYIEAVLNDVGQQCLLLHHKEKKYAVYPWMTNFQEALDFLRKNGKLN